MRIKVARPTITVAGQDQASLAEGLLSLLVVESTQGLFRCEATFGNWGGGPEGGVGFLYFDRKLLDFGKALAVKLGVGHGLRRPHHGDSRRTSPRAAPPS